MLVINNANVELIEQLFSIKDVTERYEGVRLDLPKGKIQDLLRNGELSRERMLLCWEHVKPEDVENDIGMEYLQRNELVAITRNPKLARLALKHRDVFTTAGVVSLGCAFEHITLDEAEMYDIKLHEVVGNKSVSVDVKRLLIHKGFQSGELPVVTDEELRKYINADITPELVCQLEQINYPDNLIDPSLLEHASLRRYNDLSSRLILSLCGEYNEGMVETLMGMDVNDFPITEYIVWFKGPTTVNQSTKLLDEHGHKPIGVKYLASKGRFNSDTLERMIEYITHVGDESSMVSLYENPHLTLSDRKRLYDLVSPSIPMSAIRRRMFDKYVLDCKSSDLDKFCQAWCTDPIMLFMVTSPLAYKRAALRYISRIDPEGIPAHDIISKCSGITFTDEEAEILLGVVRDTVDYEASTRLLMMVGISVKIKRCLLDSINSSRHAA